MELELIGIWIGAGQDLMEALVWCLRHGWLIEPALCLGGWLIEPAHFSDGWLIEPAHSSDGWLMEPAHFSDGWLIEPAQMRFCLYHSCFHGIFLFDDGFFQSHCHWI